MAEGQLGCFNITPVSLNYFISLNNWSNNFLILTQVIIEVKVCFMTLNTWFKNSAKQKEIAAYEFLLNLIQSEMMLL